MGFLIIPQRAGDPPTAWTDGQGFEKKFNLYGYLLRLHCIERRLSPLTVDEYFHVWKINGTPTRIRSIVEDRHYAQYYQRMFLNWVRYNYPTIYSLPSWEELSASISRR